MARPSRFRNLADVIEGVERGATSLEAADAAAQMLEGIMRAGTARAIGADLRLSGFRGAPVEFKPQRSPGRAAIAMGGGTYALADAGRRRAKRRIRSKRRKRRGQRAPALLTPQGPRRSVRGSRWAGKRITDTYGPKALDEAVEAARDVIVAGFAKAVG